MYLSKFSISSGYLVSLCIAVGKKSFSSRRRQRLFPAVSYIKQMKSHNSFIHSASRPFSNLAQCMQSTRVISDITTNNSWVIKTFWKTCYLQQIAFIPIFNSGRLIQTDKFETYVYKSHNEPRIEIHYFLSNYYILIVFNSAQILIQLIINFGHMLLVMHNFTVTSSQLLNLIRFI